MKIEGDDAVFSSGRTTAVYGVIGLGIDPLEAHIGYDGILFDFEDPPTREERWELAEYMIAQWQKYAQEE